MTFFKITALLSHVNLLETEQTLVEQALKKISQSEKEQEAFFSYCKVWKMAPLINFQLIKYGLSNLFSEKIQADFQNLHQQIQDENKNRTTVAISVLRAFEQANIDVVILKGNLFATTIYKDEGYKKMNDFDLLIHANDWEKVQEIYFKLGFIPLGYGWGGEKQKPTKFSHTAIPFISPDFKCIIGTQWGLKSPTAGFKINMEEAWNTSLPFNFHGVKCKQLSPEFNLLHLILHLGIYKCGIRDCMDIYNLYDVSKPNKDLFITLLKKTKTTEKARFAFELCSLCSDKIPAEYIPKFRKNNFIARRTNKRTKMHAETGDFQLSYNDYFQDVEKNVLYLNAVTKFHQRLFYYGKILRLTLFPDNKHCLKFIDKAHQPTFFNRIKGRFLACYFSFSLIAQEIGRKVTALLFVKLFFDVLFSLVFYIFPRKSYFEYLKDRNIDPEKIKKIVSNVQ